MVGLGSTTKLSARLFCKESWCWSPLFCSNVFLGSSTAFCSDRVIDSDHDQSETTKCSCKKIALDDDHRSKNWTSRSSYETLSRIPPLFFVRAYLRDDAVCGDFMLGLVPPLCSASGSGKVNKYYMQKTWHNTTPRMHTLIQVISYSNWFVDIPYEPWLVSVVSTSQRDFAPGSLPSRSCFSSWLRWWPSKLCSSARRTPISPSMIRGLPSGKLT